MSEQGRAAQINNLCALGWVYDEECKSLAWGAFDDAVGGPDILRGPDGRYYEVSCGQERPLDGSYRRMLGPFPTTMAEARESESDPARFKTVIYANGTQVGAQG